MFNFQWNVNNKQILKYLKVQIRTYEFKLKFEQFYNNNNDSMIIC